MKALPFTKVVLEEFDESTSIIKRSGKHTRKSDATDKSKIVEELMKSNAFMPRANRKYSVFKDIKPSLLTGFNYHSLYDWIDKHKDDIEKKKKEKHANDALKTVMHGERYILIVYSYLHNCFFVLTSIK